MLLKSGVSEPAVLETLLHAIGKTRATLRYTHLQAHLKTPEGHDPVMWKKHNN